MITYIGTYTRPEAHVKGAAEGIYVYQLDGASGQLHHLSTARDVVNPSFLTVDPSGRFLYAVQEVGEFAGQPGGAVSAFRIDPQTHGLELINHQPTHGTHPCYVSIDSTGRWLLVANYGGRSVSVLPIGADGALGPATAVVKHHGYSSHHDGPHPHAIMTTPDGDFILVPDCGLDRIFVYRLDTASGTLAPHKVAYAPLHPGAGPRHLAFHPSGTFLACVNERGSSVTTLRYDRARGEFAEVQTISTLPVAFGGRNSCADIHIDPTGRSLYASNRGHDSIAIFSIDPASGQLRAMGHVATGGRTPRNFALDPGGNLLLAANQDTDTVVPFRIDSATGLLSSTGIINNVPTPVCVCIVPGM